MLVTSIKQQPEIMAIPPTLVPKSVTAEHYRDVFIKSNMPRYFINSTIVAAGSTLIAIGFAILGGYGFARHQFRGKILLQNAVLSSQMLPTASIIIPLFIILRSLNLLNTYFGLILAYLIITLPLSVWMMTGYFRSIPIEMEEAAFIDGCSRFGVLWRVVLPVSIPGLVATIVYCFVVTWNEFLFALCFAMDKRVMTLPIGLAEFILEFTVDWGALMAGSVLMTLPIVILFFTIQRAFISGLTSGSTKG
jgi:ABC-type glycerol-3-phosphate transport system permease component